MAYQNTPQQMNEELQKFRDEISCIVVLEQAGYRFVRSESSARHMRFRRVKGESIIVTHGGKGWWDPHNSSSIVKGSVIDLVRFLNPGMSLGNARVELRGMLGLAPSGAEYVAEPKERKPARDPNYMWKNRQAPQPGSAAWTYLTRDRALPERILHLANQQGLLREGMKGTAWFAHHNNAGGLTGMEMRGPEYRGFSSGGGGKMLFRMRTGEKGVKPVRLVIGESAIDVLSYASMDPFFADPSLYVSTGGGMSPEALEEFRALLGTIEAGGRVMIVVDGDAQGDRYEEIYAPMIREAGLKPLRYSPKGEDKDWNAVLQRRARQDVAA